MQVVAITAPRRCELVHKPDPHPKDNFVVVKVHVVPMCTEYKAYQEGYRSETLGHEAAGEVVEVAQSGKVRAGERVAVMPLYPCGKCALCGSGEYIHCQHPVDPLRATGNEAGTATYAQYLIKPDWLLLPLPEEFSYEHGSMACCGLGPTFGAMQVLGVEAFDTVLITGMGPVGLGGVINATFRGARVIAVEGHPYRRRLAKALGAEAVIDPSAGDALEQVMALSGGLGADKGLDCSGAPRAQRFLIDAARRKGKVAYVGESGGHKLEVTVARDLLRKGLSLHGSWHWNLADAPKLMRVIRGSREKLDQLITHTFPMSRVAEAWEQQLTGASGKVLLKPWE